MQRNCRRVSADPEFGCCNASKVTELLQQTPKMREMIVNHVDKGDFNLKLIKDSLGLKGTCSSKDSRDNLNMVHSKKPHSSSKNKSSLIDDGLAVYFQGILHLPPFFLKSSSIFIYDVRDG